MANGDQKTISGYEKRRQRLLAVACLPVLAALSPMVVHSAEMIVGVAAPLSGPSALLGAQIIEGATAAARLPGNTIRLDMADDGCSAEGGAKAAEQFVAAKVQIVVGFLCTEAIEAAMPALKAANIPVITVGVRTDSLTDRREKTGWPVFRLGPRADGEQTAVATLLTRLWRDELFAIVDDGTIYGRELAESFRIAAEQAGLKAVFVDTFRPQMDNQIALAGRLRRSGATHVFVGGDREDIAILGRDARGLSMTLTIAGGEALRAASGSVPLEPGTLMIGLPEWSEIASPAIVAALRANGTEPEGYVLPAYAAIEIAATALADQNPSLPLAEKLGAREFQTALGPIRFDAKGDLAENPYHIYRFGSGGSFQMQRGQTQQGEVE